MKLNLKNALLICLAAFVVQGCGSGAKTSALKINDLVLLAEGPLFEGSNTAQVESSNSLDSFLKEKGITKDDVSSARLTGCSISYKPQTDSSEMQNMDALQSISLQFAADELDMQSVAVVNPLAEGLNQVDLNVANEQEDIVAFLKQENFYVVADAILEQDLNDNIVLLCNLTFEIKHK